MTSHLQGVGNGDLITLITTFLGAPIKCSINLQWQFETMFVLYLEVYVAAKHNFVFQVESDKHFAEMSNASNREEAIVRWHEHPQSRGRTVQERYFHGDSFSIWITKTNNPWQGFYTELHIWSISGCHSLVKSLSGETHIVSFTFMFIVNGQLCHYRDFLRFYCSEVQLNILYHFLHVKNGN